MTKTVEFTSVKPETVREFAKAHGIEVGARGRFSESLVKAFNKGKRGPARYDEGKTYAPHITVTAKVKGKPPVRKTVPVPVVREAAEAAGVKIGARGRIPSNVAKAFVLGTLSDLASE